MRILFITATRIGDVVISTGLLHHLTEKYPGARITVACGPLASSLFAEVPGLEKVIVLDKKSFGRHWFALWGKIRKTRWDLIVDLRRSLVSYFVWTENRARLGIDDRKSHRVVLLSQFLGLDPPVAPRLWTGKPHKEEAMAIVPDGQPVVAVAPIAARPEKTWPIDRFAELCRRLVGGAGPLQECRFLIVGAEQDRSQLALLIAHLDFDDQIELIGCPDLLTVYEALSRSSLIIANDSGMAHLAASTGRPTVALFGPTSPELYRPWGQNVAVALAPQRGGQRVIEDLDVSDALAAADTVLN